MRNFLNLRRFVILIYLLCTACGTALPSVKPFKLDVQQGNVVTSKMLLQLRPGMTKSQVRFIMGSPLIQDSFHGNRWDYAYQLRENGKLKEQRRVILDFENDVLKTVRGDVVPAGSEAAKALQVEADAAAVVVKKEEEKSMVDKLKFWDKSDDVKSTPTEPANIKAPKKAGGEIVNSQVAAPEALLANQADAKVGEVTAPQQAAVMSEVMPNAAAINDNSANDVASSANNVQANDAPSVLAVPLVVEPVVAESVVYEPLVAEAIPKADSAPVVSSVPGTEPAASPTPASSMVVDEAPAVVPTPPVVSNADVSDSDKSNPGTGSQENLPLSDSTYHSEAGMLFDRSLKMTPLDSATIAAQMAADDAASASQSNSDIPLPKPLPAEAEPGLFDRMLERIGF